MLRALDPAVNADQPPVAGGNPHLRPRKPYPFGPCEYDEDLDGPRRPPGLRPAKVDMPNRDLHRAGTRVQVRPVWLNRRVLLVAQSLAQDRVLGHLWYWTVPRRKGERPRTKFVVDRRGWVWRTAPWFAATVGLTEGQLRRALITVHERGFVTKGRGHHGRTLWSVDVPAITAAAQDVADARAAARPADTRPAVGLRLKNRRGIRLPEWVVMLARSQAEQRFLGRLDYWLDTSKATGRPRARFHLTDRLHWEEKSYAEWADEMVMTPDAVERAVRSLRGRGLVVTKPVREGGPINFRIDYDAVRAAVAAG